MTNKLPIYTIKRHAQGYVTWDEDAEGVIPTVTNMRSFWGKSNAPYALAERIAHQLNNAYDNLVMARQKHGLPLDEWQEHELMFFAPDMAFWTGWAQGLLSVHGYPDEAEASAHAANIAAFLNDWHWRDTVPFLRSKTWLWKKED